MKPGEILVLYLEAFYKMKDVLSFLLEVGKLKGKKRRGWLLHQINNPETTAEHIFHLALLVWVLGAKKKINLQRALKIALMHDLCEVYAKDLTPYDPLLPKNNNKKKIMEVLKRWPKFTPALKIKKEREKEKMETVGLDRLIAKAPEDFKKELKNLWLDYLRGLSAEARFVKQADKMVNFLQGMDYWRRYGKIQHRLWVRWIKEIIDDPVLVEFASAVEEKFCAGHKHKNSTTK